MNRSPSSAPAIVRTCFGRPTYDGKKHLGTSSPANPALIVPLPLSMTMGALCNREPMVGAVVNITYAMRQLERAQVQQMRGATTATVRAGAAMMNFPGD